MAIAYITLMLGAMGQAGFYGSFITPHVSGWLGLCIAFPPLLIVYTLTFLKQPFLPPHLLRRSIIVAMTWLAVGIVLAETLAHFGKLEPDSEKNAVTLCRILMHLGWISFFPLTRLCSIAKDAHAKMESGSIDKTQRRTMPEVRIQNE